MVVGVPGEVKTQEHRVALTPVGARELRDRGVDVVVQAGAGTGSGIADDDYAAQGARIVPDADAVFEQAQLIVKVKEPHPDEVARLRPDHTLFAYLHLAPDSQLAHGLMASGATCIAYETVEDGSGRLPLLAPMSEIAGKLASQCAASALVKPLGGRGTLMGGAPGVAPAKVTIVGGGVVGLNAAYVAIGMGADVTILDRNVERLRELDAILGVRRARLLFASTLTVERLLPESDVVIGAVLVHGARAPRVVTREQVGLMREGSVMVDVSIDQGGCFETSRPTTQDDPTYQVDGVVHYCVTNMPGAVPVTATESLTNATLPYVLALGRDVREALAADPALAAGVNVAGGHVTCRPVADALGLEHRALDDALAAVAA